MGKMIASYLDSKSELDDSAVHLLFSANRWEKRFVRSTILVSCCPHDERSCEADGCALSMFKELCVNEIGGVL
jgi:hypothetical protein